MFNAHNAKLVGIYYKMEIAFYVAQQKKLITAKYVIKIKIVKHVLKDIL